jgi:adenylate cyclase
MTSTRRLAAILAADVAGYSRLIGADESSTLERLKAIRAELIDPTIAAHNGRLVKTTGDGRPCCMDQPVDAVIPGPRGLIRCGRSSGVPAPARG